MFRKFSRNAFTLIELLVVIAIITIVAALLISAVTKARESARSAQCRTNLRNIGVGMYLNADRSPTAEFCSGALDFQRDGCIDRWGWVADQINQGWSAADSIKCPTNPIQVNEKLLEVYGIETNDGDNTLTGFYRSRATDGMCGQSEWKGITGSGATDVGFATTDELTEERRALVSRYFLEQGFNSNYAASWFLIHTAPRVRWRESDQTLRTNGVVGGQGLRGKADSQGVLTSSYVARTERSSSTIPLIGDAAPGDLDEAIAPIALSYGPGDLFADGDTSRRTFAEVGALLCESVGEGPTFYHTTQKVIKRIGSNNSRLENQVRCELAGNCLPPAQRTTATRTYLQSTLTWMAVHGGSGGYSMNMLFADGSVRSYTDQNNDLFLNPGFPIPDDLTDLEYSRIGYRGSEIELPEAEVFSGIFITPQLFKMVFE